MSQSTATLKLAAAQAQPNEIELKRLPKNEDGDEEDDYRNLNYLNKAKPATPTSDQRTDAGDDEKEEEKV